MGAEDFDHFARTFFAWSVRRNRTDAKSKLPPGHSNGNSIADVDFTACTCLLSIHRHSTRIARLFGKSATQDHSAPL